jgi:hypothetical protein
MKTFEVLFRITDNYDLCESDDEFGYIAPRESTILLAENEEVALSKFYGQMYGYRTDSVDIFEITQ